MAGKALLSEGFQVLIRFDMFGKEQSLNILQETNTAATARGEKAVSVGQIELWSLQGEGLGAGSSLGEHWEWERAWGGWEWGSRSGCCLWSSTGVTLVCATCRL